ncbi:hypothetical protein [Lysinibacillus fusiformis]|uniref:hypothetical protein n=1 Tax=Lysinibacillus fusiformis TaxID=28031 RepID=UPI00263A78C5|nr:hypothetical protein [Lysinibacillus fusiformis]MDC6267309.1 hypothetical protein [Lysinibacillus sphaericus]MDN4968257.1 hypothetical protein [Lysinibacillus fusiformis]MDN4968431.1 hypothetical protein [Lysinibacillus fusiformis]
MAEYKCFTCGGKHQYKEDCVECKGCIYWDRVQCSFPCVDCKKGFKKITKCYVENINLLKETFHEKGGLN